MLLVVKLHGYTSRGRGFRRIRRHQLGNRFREYGTAGVGLYPVARCSTGTHYIHSLDVCYTSLGLIPHTPISIHAPSTDQLWYKIITPLYIHADRNANVSRNRYSTGSSEPQNRELVAIDTCIARMADHTNS